ncbi:hypothetical protein N7493_010751 [Penicillium malachiteum]|uniref:Uncharacterized protein n=1 Tax=Penicillium malachiteum TaxID=1324776 RepID=A0AAD6MRT0_9EURO|nr:hypothetical protein N7493_010751 [Penicillium malachiteum]
MRTRSQPLSPGGLKSLDDLPRRRRATRSASVTEPTTTATKVEKTKPTARGRKPRAKKAAGRKKVNKPNPHTDNLTIANKTIFKTTKKTDDHPDAVESTNPVLEGTVSAANEQPLTRLSELTPKKSPSRLNSNKQSPVQVSDKKNEQTSPFTIGNKATSPKKITEHDSLSARKTRPSKATPRTPSRHRTPLRVHNATPIVRRSRVPYSTIASRRRSVAGGHVSQTLFRLPDLIDEAGLIEPSPETRPSHFEENPESTSALPATPTSKNSTIPNIPQTAPVARVSSSPGWSRWIFDSVSRRWSTMRGRLDFNRAGDSQIAPAEETAETSVPSAQSAQQALGTEPFPSVIEESTEPELPLPSPSHYTHPRRTRRRSTTTTPTNTTYSLRPAGFSAELIEKCFPSLPPAEIAARVRRLSNSGSGLLPSDVNLASEEQSKKRKRPPSPETIPNPPGCSYGINDEYFEFDSDDEEWAAEEQARRDALAENKSATEETEGPAAKKQRVEESAPKQKRPGYDRNRPHRLYRPTHLPTVESSEFLSEPPSAGSPIFRGGGNAAGWIVRNPHGTFQTPGWDSSSSDEPVLDETPAEEQPVVLDETPAQPATPSQAAVSPHGASAEVHETSDDPSPLSRARNKAEQFKPKTPSRLREAHPWLKSPATGSPSSGPRPASAATTDTPRNVRVGTSPFVTDPMSVDGSSYLKSAETGEAQFDPDDSLTGMEESGEMGTEWLLGESHDGDMGGLDWPSATGLGEIFSVRGAERAMSGDGKAPLAYNYWGQEREMGVVGA